MNSDYNQRSWNLFKIFVITLGSLPDVSEQSASFSLLIASIAFRDLILQ